MTLFGLVFSQVGCCRGDRYGVIRRSPTSLSVVTAAPTGASATVIVVVIVGEIQALFTHDGGDV